MYCRYQIHYMFTIYMTSLVGLGTEPFDQDDDDEKTCNDLNSTSDDLDDKKTI